MKTLTPAQLLALKKFASVTGHGFGEYAYLPRTTAYALARAGLITIGSVPCHSHRTGTIAWGIITAAGVEALNAARVYEWEREVVLAPHHAFGFTPWRTIPAARRGGAATPQIVVAR